MAFPFALRKETSCSETERMALKLIGTVAQLASSKSFEGGEFELSSVWRNPNRNLK